MTVEEKRRGDGELPPAAVEERNVRDIYGLYETSDTWRWSLFCPQKGDVIVTQVPMPVAPEEGVYGAFVTLSKTMLSDGSLILAVKSLGSSEASTTTSLSKAFNRRPGCIHVCHGVGECHCRDEEIVFHCVSLELADGASFSASYLGTAGKRLLKQVRDSLEEGKLDERAWKENEEGEERNPDRVDRERERSGDRERREKAGKGDGAQRTQNDQQYMRLRERLENAKRKQRPRDDSREPEHPQGRRAPELEQTVGIPQLNSSHKLGIFGGALTGEAKEPRTMRTMGNPGRQGGATNMLTMNGWNRIANTGSVGSQLVMRAAANLPGGSGGGGLPPGGGLPTLLGSSGRKKKKKKKEKKKKKRKKSRRRRKSGGGGPSGGGSSGGSSSGSSDSSESSSTGSSGESAYLPPLRRRSEKRPGSVLKLLLEQVESQLSELQGAETHSAVLLGGTKLLTFYHLLLRGNGVQTSSRDGRELYLIAILLDLLRSGQLERLADGLAARFLALQTAVMDGGWHAARHLEIFTPDQATPGGASVTLAARKHARTLEKVKGSESRRDTGRGGQWNRQWSPWQWPRTEEAGGQENGKGKGKKGKVKQGKGSPWNSKGGNSWKGSGGGDGKGSEKEKAPGEKSNAESK